MRFIISNFIKKTTIIIVRKIKKPPKLFEGLQRVHR